jgi:hypothetical protein
MTGPHRDSEAHQPDHQQSHVGGGLSLNGSKVSGTLNMNGLRVDQALFMGDKAEFANVDLTGAHVGGQLQLNGSKVIDTLNMNGLRVDQALFMGDEAEFANVELTGAHVVALRVDDVAPQGYAIDRVNVRQRKTGRPVRFELTERRGSLSTRICATAVGSRGRFCFQVEAPRSISDDAAVRAPGGAMGCQRLS